MKSILHCSLCQFPRKGCNRSLPSSQNFVCCPLGLGYPGENNHAPPGSAKSALCQVCLVETFAWCLLSAYCDLVCADCCWRWMVVLNILRKGQLSSDSNGGTMHCTIMQPCRGLHHHSNCCIVPYGREIEVDTSKDLWYRYHILKFIMILSLLILDEHPQLIIHTSTTCAILV